MQSWINAQRRYCASPRLDCARDASLEHQQNHGAARKQGKSTLWFFFRSFFLRSFFLRCFFLRKITIMASVSKLFLAQTDRMGMKFFWQFFFGNQGSDYEKVRQKITMMARGSKDSEKPKKRIGKKICPWKFWPKNCPGVSRLFFSETYSGKETRNEK